VSRTGFEVSVEPGPAHFVDLTETGNRLDGELVHVLDRVGGPRTRANVPVPATADPRYSVALLLPVTAEAGLGQASRSSLERANCGVVKLGAKQWFFSTQGMGCDAAVPLAKRIYRSPHNSYEPPNYDCKVLPPSRGGGGCTHEFKDKGFFWYRGE